MNRSTTKITLLGSNTKVRINNALTGKSGQNNINQMASERASGDVDIAINKQQEKIPKCTIPATR